MNCFFNALFMFINNPEVRDLNYRQYEMTRRKQKSNSP